MRRDAGALTSAGAGGAAAARVGPDDTGALLVTYSSTTALEIAWRCSNSAPMLDSAFCFTPTHSCMQATSPLISPAHICKAHTCAAKHLLISAA